MSAFPPVPPVSPRRAMTRGQLAVAAASGFRAKKSKNIPPAAPVSLKNRADEQARAKQRAKKPAKKQVTFSPPPPPLVERSRSTEVAEFLVGSLAAGKVTNESPKSPAKKQNSPFPEAPPGSLRSYELEPDLTRRQALSKLKSVPMEVFNDPKSVEQQKEHYFEFADYAVAAEITLPVHPFWHPDRSKGWVQHQFGVHQNKDGRVRVFDMDSTDYAQCVQQEYNRKTPKEPTSESSAQSEKVEEPKPQLSHEEWKQQLKLLAQQAPVLKHKDKVADIDTEIKSLHEKIKELDDQAFEKQGQIQSYKSLQEQLQTQINRCKTRLKRLEGAMKDQNIKREQLQRECDESNAAIQENRKKMQELQTKKRNISQKSEHFVQNLLNWADDLDGSDLDVSDLDVGDLDPLPNDALKHFNVDNVFPSGGPGAIGASNVVPSGVSDNISKSKAETSKLQDKAREEAAAIAASTENTGKAGMQKRKRHSKGVSSPKPPKKAKKSNSQKSHLEESSDKEEDSNDDASASESVSESVSESESESDSESESSEGEDSDEENSDEEDSDGSEDDDDDDSDSDSATQAQEAGLGKPVKYDWINGRGYGPDPDRKAKTHDWQKDFTQKEWKKIQGMSPHCRACHGFNNQPHTKDEFCVKAREWTKKRRKYYWAKKKKALAKMQAKENKRKLKRRQRKSAKKAKKK